MKSGRNGILDMPGLGEADLFFAGMDVDIDLVGREIHAEDGRYVLSLRVPGVTASGVQIDRAGDALQVRLGRFRRTLPLPQYLVGLSPSWAQLEGQRLVIVFEPS